MDVKKIKEFANTLYDLLKKDKLPRRNIKRILYDRGIKLGINENTLDVIWNAFMEDTYTPYGKNFSLKKKSKEISIIMKGKKTPIIVLNKKTNVSKEFASQAEAARYVKTAPATMYKLLNEGRDYKGFSVYFKNEAPLSVLRTITNNNSKINHKEEPLSAKTIIKEAKKVEDDVKKRSSFERAGDPSKDNPILDDWSPYAETPKQLPQSEHNLDDARHAYIEALIDAATKRILKFGIQLEEQEKKLLEDILK
jgi:hypothetical protein